MWLRKKVKNDRIWKELNPSLLDLKMEEGGNEPRCGL